VTAQQTERMRPHDGAAIPGSERSFGLLVGTVLCLIAALLFWRGRPIRAEIVGAIGAALVLLGAVAPSLLRWPRFWWWRGARVVGDFNARVLLTVMFVAVLLPISLIWRLTGKDPLARRRTASSGWSPYSNRYRDRRHYLRMY
jgi:saxitoxin biosynthesis operon SxtJ-like protein